MAAAWVVALLAAAHRAPGAYYEAMQEDRATEWLTAVLFGAAAMLGGLRAFRHRRLADALVAAFCVAATGEELSWGQRILGYTPSELFLANNVQQEANLHNLVEAFGQPKWTLIAILLAFGILAPLATRFIPTASRLAVRFGFTPPPVAAIGWFALAIALLVAYPVPFTSEWVEALAGALFLVALRPAPRVLLATLAASALLALALERAVAEGGAREGGAIACAGLEVNRLAASVREDPRLAARPMRRLHRRIWTLVQARDVEPAVLAALHDVPCGAGDDATLRRRAYGVDAWGTAYWVRIEPTARGRRIEVYSFGPNRRRDPEGGDDIRAVVE